jgi:hypothetical protein
VDETKRESQVLLQEQNEIEQKGESWLDFDHSY